MLNFMNKLIAELNWHVNEEDPREVFSNSFPTKREAKKRANEFKDQLGVDVNFSIVGNEGNYQIQFNREDISAVYEFIAFMNRLNADGIWRFNKNKVFSTLFSNKEEAIKCANEFKDKLGVNVEPQIIKSKGGTFQVKFDKQEISTEYKKRQERLAQFKSDLKQKRIRREILEKQEVKLEVPEVRVPAILRRGGNAQGLLKREHYMLTLEQINFVRKIQLEQALNTDRREKVGEQLGEYREKEKNSILNTKQLQDKDISKAKNIIISHKSNEACSKIFTPEDPPVLIGAKGEAFILCEQAKLGDGGQGVVYIGQNLDTGEFCVIKSLHKVTADTLEDFTIETKHLEDLNQLIDTLDTSNLDKSDYQGPKKLYSAIDLAWEKDYIGELFESKLIKHDFLSRLDMFIKALEEIHDLHGKNKLHRDIKLENLMWDGQNEVAKLVDFGMAGNMDSKGVVRDGDLIGTDDQIAPELWENMRNKKKYEYTKKTDIYAAGILGCHIFAEKWIFDDKKNEGYYEYKKNKKKDGPLPAILAKLNMFTETNTPEQRKKKKVYDEIIKMIDVNPKNRLSLEETLANLKDIQHDLRSDHVFPRQKAQKQMLYSEADSGIQKDSMEKYMAKQKKDQAEHIAKQKKDQAEKMDQAANKILHLHLSKLFDSADALSEKLIHILHEKKSVRFSQNNEITKDIDIIEHLIKIIVNTNNKEIITANDLEMLGADMKKLNIQENRNSLFNIMEYNKSSETRKLINHATQIITSLIKSTKEYEEGMGMTAK